MVIDANDIKKYNYMVFQVDMLHFGGDSEQVIHKGYCRQWLSQREISAKSRGTEQHNYI